MDWITNFINAINYIENHLLDDLTINDIASNVFISPFYFQKVFSIYTGYTVSEYIRSRRLYQAAVEIKSSEKSITEIAYKYGYETPEAFSKAFYRFHGVIPSKARNKKTPIQVFLPLHISIHISGGDKMDFVIKEEKELKFIGFVKEIKAEEGYVKCPEFWNEFNNQYVTKLEDNSECSKAIKENEIGCFAICFDGNGKTFKYMIGGIYQGGNVPKEMEVLELSSLTWAKFKCVGPLPGALQSVNTKIWSEWIPNNPKYELAQNVDIEWYSNDDMTKDDYVSEIWLPVQLKK